MCKLEILNHWIVPQQGENHSEIDEEPKFEHLVRSPGVSSLWAGLVKLGAIVVN